MSEKPLDADKSGFLSRWSRKKAEASEEAASVAQRVLDPVNDSSVQTSPEQTALLTPTDHDGPQVVPAEPLPTMADVAELTPSSDFKRFMRQGVDPSTRNAAMKTLFKDPHFNVMDMMDVYVDDYSKPDPIPFEMLKTLNQAMDLDLFKREENDQDGDQGSDQCGDQMSDEVAQLDATKPVQQIEHVEPPTEAPLEEANKGQRV